MTETSEGLPSAGTVVAWIVVAIITLLIPALAVFLRTYIAQTKEDRLRKTERHYDLNKTEAFRRAVGEVPEHALSHYLLSLFVLTIIIGINAYLLVFGGKLDLDEYNSILAGGYIGDITDYELKVYQSKTLLVISMAFLGAYIWSVQMTFRRIVTFDLSPGTFQAISVRIIVATMVATVIRHTYDFAGGELDQAVLVTLGFGCGIFPQLAIGYLKERAKMLFPGGMQEAEELPLTLIEGISVFDRVRLAELGVEDAQNLAHANPIQVFIRTPYRLELVMDWIAQAQALVFLTCANYKKLRQKLLIRTIFDLHDSLVKDESRGAVISELDIAPPVLESLRDTLEKKPAFVRLVELRDRMLGYTDRR